MAKQIQFKGWKLKSGEIIRHIDIAGERIFPGQHEAGKVQIALNYKGRLTPQYDRS